MKGFADFCFIFCFLTFILKANCYHISPEIRELDFKLSGKLGKYQGISFHELAGNPVIVRSDKCHSHGGNQAILIIVMFSLIYRPFLTSSDGGDLSQRFVSVSLLSAPTWWNSEIFMTSPYPDTSNSVFVGNLRDFLICFLSLALL